MKRKIFLTVYVVVISITTIFAQQGIVTSGSSFNTSTTHMSFSVGQLAQSSYSSDNIYVNEGIQQPDVITTQIVEIENINISVFPNPVFSFINIYSDVTEDITVIIYSADGKIMLNQLYNMPAKINVESFAAGNYLVKLSNSKGQQNTYSIIKQ